MTATPSEGVEAPSPSPSLLHPLSPLYDVLGAGRQLLAPGVIALTAGGLRLLVAGLLVVLAARVVAWRRWTWSFDGAVLRIDSGVFGRAQQLVPAERIQQVNLVQHLRHRIAGVAVLRVETAGTGAAATVELEVLAEPDAVRLRSELLAAKAATTRTTVPVDDEGRPAWVPTVWPVVELGYGRLALAGATGEERLFLLPVVVTLAEVADLFGGDDSPFAGTDLGAVAPLAAAVLVAIGVAVWLGSAAAVAVVRNAGYRLDLVGDELHLRRGLLDRKEAVLPLGRIQAVRITASPLRRALGLTQVRLQSAGVRTDREESRVEIPILAAAEVNRVLALALPGAEIPATLHPPPPAARRRAVVRRLVPAAVVAVAVAVAAFPWGAIAGFAVPAAVAHGVAAYRGLGHAVTPHLVVTRSGALSRRTILVPRTRVQSGRVVSSPLQRRLGLATTHVDVAGPRIRARVVDEDEMVAEGVLADIVGGQRGRGARLRR